MRGRHHGHGHGHGRRGWGGGWGWYGPSYYECDPYFDPYCPVVPVVAPVLISGFDLHLGSPIGVAKPTPFTPVASIKPVITSLKAPLLSRPKVTAQQPIVMSRLPVPRSVVSAPSPSPQTQPPPSNGNGGGGGGGYSGGGGGDDGPPAVVPGTDDVPMPGEGQPEDQQYVDQSMMQMDPDTLLQYGYSYGSQAFLVGYPYSYGEDPFMYGFSLGWYHTMLEWWDPFKAQMQGEGDQIQPLSPEWGPDEGTDNATVGALPRNRISPKQRMHF